MMLASNRQLDIEGTGRPRIMNQSLYESYQAMARGTTVNSVTLLATDYLNHFNEAVMLLEIVPDMPDMLDDVKDWQPKSYADHFRDSQFKLRDLAIEAYEVSPPEYRKPFDAVIAKLNRMIADAIDSVGVSICGTNEEQLRDTVGNITVALRTEIDRAGAIINGSAERIDQDAVDAIFDDPPVVSTEMVESEGVVIPDNPLRTTQPGYSFASILPDMVVPYEIAIAFSRSIAEVLAVAREGALSNECMEIE